VHDKSRFEAVDADLGVLLLKADKGGTMSFERCRKHGELLVEGEGIDVSGVAPVTAAE
jgi:hypothetical protein